MGRGRGPVHSVGAAKPLRIEETGIFLHSVGAAKALRIEETGIFFTWPLGHLSPLEQINSHHEPDLFFTPL